ncbi:MAG: pyrroline-5-carboxylate reductase [Steroidobacteraceae bacterium]
MNNCPAARIAFIGGGNMARALIGGLLRQGSSPQQLRVGEPEAAARAALEREFAVVTTPDNGAAIDGAAVVVLAVKPQVVAAVLRSLGPHWPRSLPLLLSIVAGVRIDDLAQLCPSLPIVRAMPNRPALVGAGVTALFAAPTVPVALRPLAEQVAAAAGRFLWLRAESELDIATALSGSGPAYFFLLAEQLAQAAIALGLEPATATLLATETLHGSGVLAHLGSLAEQRAAVTSSGGTTQAALEFLYAGGFDALIQGALRAAAARSAELADLAARSLSES